MKKHLAFATLLILLLFLTMLPAQADENKFAFDKSVTTLFEGETLQTALLREGDPAQGEVTYVSSAEKNAQVDENGLVTGLRKGKTTVTATLKTEKRSYRATVTLTILRRATEISVQEEKLPIFQPTDPQVTSLMQSETELPVLVLRLGTNQSLQISCLPTDASDRAVILTSSDEAIVRIKGKTLTPKAVGECDLTIASKQNPEVMRRYHLLVVQPIKKLSLTAPSKKIYVGESLTLTPEYSPENASIKAVTYKSANEKVAVVDENGVVTGIGKGSAAIKATAADGSGRSASFTVQVLQQPTAITLNTNAVSVHVGANKTLKATVEPKNASNKKVTWTSSDESVAKVSSSGRVTPVAPGKCTITCQSQEFPIVSAQATVEVTRLISKIAFTQKEVSVNVGSSVLVFWETLPLDATNPSVTLSSSKEAIATVDQDGTIHGVKRGECTVTATANDGSGKKARIKVNVLQPVEGVHMKSDTLRVGVDESITAIAVLEPSDASNTRMSWVSADETIATVSGKRTKPTITGCRWGETTITGTTDDGGFTTTATIKVGNFDRALKITDLYLSDNRIKISVKNESNMNVTRFFFTIACYDASGAPLPCNMSGGNTFEGSYTYTLYEGDVTEHGRFSFGDFVQPSDAIAKVTMVITGYRTDSGYSRDIREDRQRVVEYKTTSYVGPTPEPAPAE